MNPIFTHEGEHRFPAPRENRLVGMFYFLWLGEHGRHKPYDVAKIVAADPEAGYHTDSEAWGKVGTYHHWGEPFYGYYYSDDEWVIRRHMKLLLQAGIDFLFFDTTNAIIYENNVKKVLTVLDEYHKAGWKIPKVMFYTNSASGQTAQSIYETIYKPNFCPDTWFYYEGKPVIIAIPEECSEEVKNFFNIKLSQWPNEPDKKGGWPWMDFVRPQRAFENLSGVPECINVSVAQHPQLRFGDSVLYGERANCGRAFRNGKNDPAPDAYTKCHNFIEQFDRALEADVPITLVTGWNEWIAGRWNGIPERPIMFVDAANPEYSRDIEMMRGGYFDNYYKVLCDYVARLKGQDSEAVIGDGETKSYLGYPDGNRNRNAEGYGTVYVNESGRNSIASVDVKNSGEWVELTVNTAGLDRDDKSGSWIEIFTKAGDRELLICPATGAVYRLTDTDSDKPAASYITAVPVKLDGDSVKVRIRRETLSGASENGELILDFKAADSKEKIERREDFYDHGDTLPLGYHMYRAILK